MSAVCGVRMRAPNVILLLLCTLCAMCVVRDACVRVRVSQCVCELACVCECVVPRPSVRRLHPGNSRVAVRVRMRAPVSGARVCVCRVRFVVRLCL